MAVLNPPYDDERVGDNMTKNLVIKLKEYMEIHEISMQQLAKVSEVSVATISRLLNFHTQPKFSTLFELYCAVGIELHIVGYSKESGEEVI